MDEKYLEAQDNYILVYDEEGNEIMLNVLFTFDSEDFDKSYVVLYDEDQNDEEEVTLHAFSYTEETDQQGELQEIESDEEWNMVEEVIATFVEEEDPDPSAE